MKLAQYNKVHLLVSYEELQDMNERNLNSFSCNITIITILIMVSSYVTNLYTSDLTCLSHKVTAACGCLNQRVTECADA